MPSRSKDQVSVNFTNEQKLYQNLLNLLQKPRRLQEVEPIIGQFGLNQNLSDSGLKRLRSKVLHGGLNEVGLKWKSGSSVRLYSSVLDADINPLEVASGISPESYLCYQTALFWNELTEQVPQAFYIAKERPTASLKSQVANRFDDFVLRDAFVKMPSEHPNVAVFGQYRYIILARTHTGRAGVETRQISFKGKKVSILITGLERTLLDCISVPENAGGVADVLKAVELGAKKINFRTFLNLYEKLDFKYPHWQRIGFLFERLGYSKLAKKWRTHFGAPKNKFFLAKGYILEWEFDESWRVYFPAGLFK